MKKILMSLLIISILFQCSNDSGTDPKQDEIDAPAVTSIQASDVGNNGNGSDLEIRFSPVNDESLISEYRVFVVQKSKELTFSLIEGESASNDRYISIDPDNTFKTFILEETSSDSGGELIKESIEYVVFVLSVADGVNSTKNTLSLPSQDVTLEQTVISAPAVTSIQVSDVGNNGNGTDLEIWFAKVSNETLVSEYRVFVVRQDDRALFTLEVAENIISDNYISITPDNTNKQLTLTENSKDSGGEVIAESIKYVVFVLSRADGITAKDNSLSTPSVVFSLEQVIEPRDSWTVANLSVELSMLATNHLKFLDETSMQGVYLELGTQDTDDREASNMDEIYYIYEGNGTLSFGSTNTTAQEGNILFIKAGSNAKFTQVINQLQVVIISMKTPTSASSPAWSEFSKSTIESTRNTSSNVWNPFIQFPNVVLGLYMLPQSQGGDGRLVHTWEELNIITSGSSAFKKDDEEIEVSKGSIFFVEPGNGHFFRSLTNDIDILILWEQP